MAPSARFTEITAMFGEVREPDEDTVRYIEDVVRAQVTSILIAARDHALRTRGPRTPITAEDVLFVCRHDAERLAQLREVLSWQPLRRKIRDDGAVYAAGIEASANAEEAILEGLSGEGVAEEKDRQAIKLPWDLEAVFGFGTDQQEDVDEPRPSSSKSLEQLDTMTRKMSREEYETYAQSRSASFVYRKAKRFRDFINLAAYVDTPPGDEVLDMLGFIAHDTCRQLCVKGLAQRAREDARFAAEDRAAIAAGSERPKKRSRSESNELPTVAVPLGPFSLAPPANETIAQPPISAVGTHTNSLLQPVRQPLTVREVDEALLESFYERTNRQHRGLRNWRAGWRPMRNTTWV